MSRVPQQSKRTRDFRRARRKSVEHAKRAREEHSREILDEYGPQGTACARKIRYQTKDEAEMYAVRYQCMRGDWLRSYPCPKCGGWHLTHQTIEERYAAIRDLRSGKVVCHQDQEDRQ